MTRNGKGDRDSIGIKSQLVAGGARTLSSPNSFCPKDVRARRSLAPPIDVEFGALPRTYAPVDMGYDEIGRKNPSPGVHVQLGQSNIVLLTVRTEANTCWLANDEPHELLHRVWRDVTEWLVGEYLLMPDHLHLFCAPRDLNFTIEQWITYWKRSFKRKHSHDWKFQSRGWHHRLRDGENFSQKWLYVQENPVRKGLVPDIHAWRYKGKVHDLPWRD